MALTFIVSGDVIGALNHCDKHLLYLGKSVTDKCLQSIVSLAGYNVYGLSANASEVKTPDNQKQLKCR